MFDKFKDNEIMEKIEVQIFAEGVSGYLSMYNSKRITIDPYTNEYMDYDAELIYPSRMIVTGCWVNEDRFLVCSSNLLESEVV